MADLPHIRFVRGLWEAEGTSDVSIFDFWKARAWCDMLNFRRHGGFIRGD